MRINQLQQIDDVKLENNPLICDICHLGMLIDIARTVCIHKNIYSMTLWNGLMKRIKRKMKMDKSSIKVMYKKASNCFNVFGIFVVWRWQGTFYVVIVINLLRFMANHGKYSQSDKTLVSARLSLFSFQTLFVLDVALECDERANSFHTSHRITRMMWKRKIVSMVKLISS